MQKEAVVVVVTPVVVVVTPVVYPVEMGMPVAARQGV
tara:strand:- start:637 stop:747 length:111 start_codon:yes stop_codon:yes gene_type:complete